MSQLLYSVNELFSSDGYLHTHQKKYYNIPLYQRGYKWEPHHIEKLLKDIEEFEPQVGKFYCLQNITIVPKDDFFNVVDGQQRLTTLTLILAYLSKRGLVNNKVRFPENSIRQQTNKFINTIITNESTRFPDDTWDDFIIKFPDYDHQDIGHLYKGYQTIQRWFQKFQAERAGNDMQFRDILLDDVKIIVNKVESIESEEKIFGNLNSKRVPLDGSDLIRAMLITRVAHEEGKKESDIKNIVRVNERRVKIGWELDQINQWWSKPDVIAYFSRFRSIKSEETSSGVKIFNDTLYPLNLLYLLFAEKRGEDELTLELVEEHNNDALGLYKELLKLHYTLQDWFNDKYIYHFLGYLFNHLRKAEFNFFDAWNLWEHSKTRYDFISSLKGLMRDSISVDGELMDYDDPETNWYDDRREMLVRSLILMDIIHSLKDKHPRLNVIAFTKTNNDIEHIFPKTPDTEKMAEQKGYVQFLNNNVVAAAADKFDLINFDKKKNDEDYRKEVIAFIETHTSAIKINSIGNLVLLFSSWNRSIQNATYPVKRARIIAYFQQGHFIQPHTFQVFIRYFNNTDNQNKDLEHWTNADIVTNTNFITQKIANFFNTK